jgi:enoyl-CoA hydratase
VTTPPPTNPPVPGGPVLVERLGPVTRLTLNRPERRNPLSARCIEELLAGVTAAEADAEVRVVVIRGSGTAFSSGYGLVPEDELPGERERPATIQDDIDAMRGHGAEWARVWGCRLPVIAQVHGWCLAGGTDLALHCDLVVAADDARIGFPPVRSMGVPPTHMWLYHVGPQWAKRLLLTGDTLSGAEAAAIGLALVAVPAEVLDDYVLALAGRMAMVDRDLLIANKQVVNHGVELMGRSQLQQVSAVYDAAAHTLPEVRAFSARVAEVGLRDAVRERDARFSDPLPGPTVTR